MAGGVGDREPGWIPAAHAPTHRVASLTSAHGEMEDTPVPPSPEISPDPLTSREEAGVTYRSERETEAGQASTLDSPGLRSSHQLPGAFQKWGKGIPECQHLLG